MQMSNLARSRQLIKYCKSITVVELFESDRSQHGYHAPCNENDDIQTLFVSCVLHSQSLDEANHHYRSSSSSLSASVSSDAGSSSLWHHSNNDDDDERQLAGEHLKTKRIRRTTSKYNDDTANVTRLIDRLMYGYDKRLRPNYKGNFHVYLRIFRPWLYSMSTTIRVSFGR